MFSPDVPSDFPQFGQGAGPEDDPGPWIEIEIWHRHDCHEVWRDSGRAREFGVFQVEEMTDSAFVYRIRTSKNGNGVNPGQIASQNRLSSPFASSPNRVVR
jgi:hypothetical protein